MYLKSTESRDLRIISHVSHFFTKLVNQIYFH